MSTINGSGAGVSEWGGDLQKVLAYLEQYRPDLQYLAFPDLVEKLTGHEKSIGDIQKALSAAQDGSINTTKGKVTDAMVQRKAELEGNGATSLPLQRGILKAVADWGTTVSDKSKETDGALKARARTLIGDLDKVDQEQAPKGVEESAFKTLQEAKRKALITQAQKDGSDAFQSYKGSVSNVLNIPAAGRVDSDGNRLPDPQGGVTQNTPMNVSQKTSSTSDYKGGVTQNTPMNVSQKTSSASDSGGQQQQVSNNSGDLQGGGSSGGGGSSSGGQGSGSGASSGKGGSGGGVPGGGASTGLQSGAALAEHAGSAAPSAPAGSGGSGGGGVGAPPSIGGIGGGPAGGAGGPARIGGIGGGPGGGGGEAPRTGAQGASAVEKSSGSSSSSGSGDRQGSGLSRDGAGVGAAGAATQAQSAQQGALRDAMRGDTAGGASNTGKHLDQQNQALGTGKITELSPTALQSAHGETAKVKSAFSGLEGQLASSHPAAASGQLASWIVTGGVVEGARRAGFLADGVTWGWVPQPPFQHTGLDGLVFLFEDMRVSPNKDEGVFRPVTARVTTTGWLGEIDPAMRLPEGTRILDRSKAPAATDHLTDAGLLARGLARWLLEGGLDGDQSWRLVAVCFLEEPDAETVDGLLRLTHPVEAFWPDRPGYEANVPQAAVEDARTLSSEELEVKQKDPLRHATDLARLDPDGFYDPTGLPSKEAGWYRKSAERAQRELLTNARWKQELDQYLREERGGGSPNW